jgi:hypothetical protein
MPGVSHGEGCYYETRQLFMQEMQRNIKNNMYPLWYEIEDDGSFQMDSNGKKIPRFDRPHKLLRLSMAEKLLI